MKNNINYKFKKDCIIDKDMVIKKGTEVIILNEMIYMNGYPLHYGYHNLFKERFNDDKFMKEYIVEAKLINNKFLN